MKSIRLLFTFLLLASIEQVSAAPDAFTRTLKLYGPNGLPTGDAATMHLTKVSVRGPEFEVLLRDGTSSDVPANTNLISEVKTYIGTVDGHPGAVSYAVRKSDGRILSKIIFDRGETWISYNPLSQTEGVAFKPEDFLNLSGKDAFDVVYMPELGPEAGIGRTLSPGQVGSDVYGFNVGLESTYNFYSTRGNNNVGETLELIEFGFLSAVVPYIRDTKLFPRIGRVIIRTSPIGDHWESAKLASKQKTLIWAEDLIASWETLEIDTDWDHVTSFAANAPGSRALLMGSVNQADGTGNYGLQFRHEMAHSWFLGHQDGSPDNNNDGLPDRDWGPEGPTINSGNYYGRFSGKEVTRMMHRRDFGGGKATEPWINRIDNLGDFTAVALPPYAAMDVAFVDPGHQILINPLANDHDANGDTLNLTAYDTISRRGGSIVYRNGLLRYTAPNSQGEDHFKYTVTDITGKTAEGVVLVDVVIGGSGSSGSAPVFTSGTIFKPDAIAGVFYAGPTLAGTATDADGDGMTYSIVQGPGWLNMTGGGAISGTPGTSNVGVNHWTVRVSDGIDGSDTATLEITVQPAAPLSDDTCPGINVGNVSGVAVPATVSNWIQRGNDDADYFSVTATESGTLTLTQRPTNSRWVSFSVGTACGNDNIFHRVNNRRVKTATTFVSAGQTIYFWADTTGYSNNNLRAYDISFDFIRDNGG